MTLLQLIIIELFFFLMEEIRFLQEQDINIILMILKKVVMLLILPVQMVFKTETKQELIVGVLVAMNVQRFYQNLILTLILQLR